MGTYKTNRWLSFEEDFGSFWGNMKVAEQKGHARSDKRIMHWSMLVIIVSIPISRLITDHSKT